jgi:hypothetical protein
MRTILPAAGVNSALPDTFPERFFPEEIFARKDFVQRTFEFERQSTTALDRASK